jgi:nucleoid-associated protein YgaU
MCSCSDTDVTNTCSVLRVSNLATAPAITWEEEPESIAIGATSGGAARRATALARRRRVVLLLAALVMLVVLALPWGGMGGHPPAFPGAPHGGPLVAGSEYVVHPGDTLWGIAARLAGNSDPRPVVAQLESEVGGDDIQPGQVLRLP